MKCPNCKADIEDSSNFCPECGFSIVKENFMENTEDVKTDPASENNKAINTTNTRDELFKAISGEKETEDEYRNILVRKNFILQLIASIPHFFLLYASWKLCDGVANIIGFFVIGVILFGISMVLMGFNHVRKDIKIYDRILKEAGKKEAIMVLENRQRGCLSYVGKVIGFIMFAVLLIGLVVELRDGGQIANDINNTMESQSLAEQETDINTDDQIETYLKEAVYVSGKELVEHSQDYQYKKISISTNVTTEAMAGLAEYTDSLRKFSQEEIEYLNTLSVWFSYDEFLGTHLLVYDDRHDNSIEVSGGDSFTTYGVFLGLSEDGMPVILARYISNGGILNIDSEEVRSRVDQDFLNTCELYTPEQIDSDATLKGMPTYGFGNILYKEFANDTNSADGYEYVVDAGVDNQPSFIVTITENFDVGDIIIVWGYLGERLAGSFGRYYLDTYGTTKYVPGEVPVVSVNGEAGSQVEEIEVYEKENVTKDLVSGQDQDDLTAIAIGDIFQTENPVCWENSSAIYFIPVQKNGYPAFFVSLGPNINSGNTVLYGIVTSTTSTANGGLVCIAEMSNYETDEYDGVLTVTWDSAETIDYPLVSYTGGMEYLFYYNDFQYSGYLQENNE